MVDVDISMGVTIPGYNWGFGTQIIIGFTVLCNEVQVEDAGLQEVLGRAVSQLYEVHDLTTDAIVNAALLALEG